MNEYLIDQLKKCDYDKLSGRDTDGTFSTKLSTTNSLVNPSFISKGSCQDVVNTNYKCYLPPNEICISQSHNSSKGKNRKMIHHDYQDFSLLTENDVHHILKERNRIKRETDVALASGEGHIPAKSKGGITETFPMKLQKLLDDIEGSHFDRIVSWQPHGRSFLIHNRKKFKEIIMKRIFRQTKITSFQRQLNLYGFFRLTQGVDSGAYFHQFFLRGKPHTAKLITRTKIKGTGFKASSNPEQEPDFYIMPLVGESNTNQGTRRYFDPIPPIPSLKDDSKIDQLLSIMNLNRDKMINQNSIQFNHYPHELSHNHNSSFQEEKSADFQAQNRKDIVRDLPLFNMTKQSNDFINREDGLFQENLAIDSHLSVKNYEFNGSIKNSCFSNRHALFSMKGSSKDKMNVFDYTMDEDDPFCPIPISIPDKPSNPFNGADYIDERDPYEPT